MSKFTTQTLPFDGPIIITPNSVGEPRNYLTDINDTDELLPLLEMEEGEEFVVQSVETMPRGVLRGLHFNRKTPQGLLIGATSGAILMVVVDLRPESKTFGASHAIELSAENQQMIYIPKFYAQGLLTLEPHTEVVINYTTESTPNRESGIIWDDEILMIDWKFDRYDIDSNRLNMTAKDKKLPSFRSYNQHDLWPGRIIKRSYALKRLLNSKL
ncbi:MAG: dTDP-4-dehydrorhamnose 3,5-epimerase [Rikenellaceae bacterium]